MSLLREEHGLVSVAGLTDDLDPVDEAEHDAEQRPHGVVVIRDHDPQRVGLDEY